MTASRRGRPLSVRLAALLSLAVIAVLLVTGIAVNRLVSRSLEEELGAAQRDRVALLAQELDGINLSQPRTQRAVQMVLQRLVRQGRGHAELRAADGTVLVSAGTLPAGAGADRLEEPVPGDAGWTLVIEVPSEDQPLLRVFNATLVIAGVLAVGALLIVSALLSERLTRPLRGVALAAQRLGAGDLSARADGGPDRESAELAEAFNAMAQRLERSEELRRRAASDMAHDLATPATVLESQMQAMVDGIVPADREQLDRARAAASAMSGVIVQLRDLVDAEAAGLQRKVEEVPLDALTDGAVQALEPLFRERGVQLDVERGAGLRVSVDRVQVGRALRNVLTNALQHSTAGRPVRLSTELTREMAVLHVSDQGPGIGEEDLPHIFERFYRADPARALGPGGGRQGSGIGLTIARELMRANGGDVWVERTGPEGTTFALSVPVA